MDPKISVNRVYDDIGERSEHEEESFEAVYFDILDNAVFFVNFCAKMENRRYSFDIEDQNFCGDRRNEKSLRILVYFKVFKLETLDFNENSHFFVD